MCFIHDNFQGDDYKFVPISEGYVDYGYLYAASTFTDPNGRQILYGWVSESLSDETVHNNGWEGGHLPKYSHYAVVIYYINPRYAECSTCSISVFKKYTVIQPS